MVGREYLRLTARIGAVGLWVVPPGLLAVAAAIALLAALMTEQTDAKAAASGAGRQSRFHA